MPLPDYAQEDTSPYSDYGMPSPQQHASPTMQLPLVDEESPIPTVPYEDYDPRTCIPAHEWSPMGDGGASSSGLHGPTTPSSQRCDLSNDLEQVLDEDIHTDEETDEEDILMDEKIADGKPDR